ncbi:serine threonine protein kinase, putative [Cordyceps militaris CM01]|uniref:non-specific serine/threonine protein kinase n=1 Tax=Cordyceps militaris (strain CM01) TaxID=983644 RepID=G3J388_CORMM|nr:serine threonine protein kinase, putative [Cordyceps militaris CM01]EGX96469.1 serine threonine protein kinase, putative [Cordyceps militaris CM01]
MDPPSQSLAPPALTTLRTLDSTLMSRSLSQDIRNEREELEEAAAQTLNVIVDLNLDGTIKWVSPSWNDVVGTPYDSLESTPLSDLIVSDNKTAFTDIVESMKGDDSKSHRVRFAMRLGPLSKLRLNQPAEHATPDEPDQELRQQEPAPTEEPDEFAQLEAQGIMVYDSASGGESHTMWMIRPWTPPQEIQIDLPDVIVDSLGSGAEVLAGYLTKLAESVEEDSEPLEPPPPVLCRICERQIPPWWFEKHTDLCLQEHRAEMDVQLAQESLNEHRHAIVKVLDALETRQSRLLEPQLTPLANYKGLPIGPPPSTQSSPSTSLARSRDRTSGFGHSRGRSFAIRRPQARIVELLMDLCDTALEISNPTIKEHSTHLNDGEIRTQSPQSESRISQVLQWQSPSTNTLDQEQGLALLCADTEKAARAKVDAIFRHRKILEYSERIRIELSCLVQDCVEEAMRKAARIAAGQLTDSSIDDTDDQQQPDVVEEREPIESESKSVISDSRSRGRSEAGSSGHLVTSPSALAAALRQVNLSAAIHGGSRPSSVVGSTGSASPKECLTPRSYVGASAYSRDGRRGSSLWLESDPGDPDDNFRSLSVSRNMPRTDSPMSEFGDLRRAASARQHQRRSLVIPGATSPRRQESPSRGATQPSSPLRIRPRIIPGSHDVMVSPEASPMFPSSEFSSPIGHPTRHHRRQSSAAISDFVMRPPPSPRLGASQAPPQARSNQPSIKDFEIIKPISKGAFGSVYLSKKKSTGEYFAIKVLKKADMVAKNQVGNVKAERAIMMWQGQSEFVAKLYWTFSSKDYLYLVMEYLNGGDCAALIKVLGGLPEEWVQKYLAEVILGVKHLHERGIIHRDLKPDNLLIDQKGHLKLTDFGLSRMGLVGRQKRALNSETSEATPDLLKQGPFVRSTSMASSRSTSLDLQGHAHSPAMTPQMTPDVGSMSQPSYFSLGQLTEPRRTSGGRRSDSGGSESLSQMLSNFSLNDSDPGALHLMASKSPVDDDAMYHGSPDIPGSLPSTRASLDTHIRNPSLPQTMMPPPMALFDPQDTNRRFVGTPDYLAPETINGDKQDETSDWWSVGCILFEFLFGVPPFHASEAEQVFENILARKIQWPDESVLETVSEEAKDLINKLLCIDPHQRLGSNREEKYACGGDEICQHAFFTGLTWDTLLEDEAQFVPQPENPEDTEYFDARGAVLQSFAEEMEDQMSPQSASGSDYPDRPHDALSRVRSQVNSMNRKLVPLHIPPHVRDMKSRRLSEPVVSDDFGNFSFKNLPVLEKANKDVIQKLRAEALAAQNKQSSSSSSAGIGSPAPSLEGSPVLANHLQRTLSNAKGSNRPQSPSGYSHATSSPSRASQPSSPLLVSFVAGGAEGRRKASSNGSSLSHQSSNLQPHAPPIDIPKGPPTLQKAITTIGVSPVKGKPTPQQLAISPQKLSTPRSAGRSRSLTVGSAESSPVATDMLHQHHRNRRSQVFDMSPSSSDNEGDRHNALLRVQRRRQSSRRLSQIAFDGGTPTFRPLDVLICEDHPVSRMVMEKLLEKLRCRTISVSNGSEAVRYSMSEIKFDVIFLEYRLPQINGADVARMIRETKNTNAHTPIVAITSYLKELQAPHYFDSLIEKPISSSKLGEVLRGLCQWRPESPQRSSSGSVTAAPVPINLRKLNPRSDDSPTSSISAFVCRQGSAMMSSREDSMSSVFGDSESVTTEDIPFVSSRKTTGDWEEGGLGIAESDILNSQDAPAPPPLLVTQQSAPGQMEQAVRSLDKFKSKREASERRSSDGTDSADDEDEEAVHKDKHHARRGSKALSGKTPLPSSKLGIEMMRANSHDSMMGASDSTPETVTQVATTPSQEVPPDLHSPAAAGEQGTTTTPPTEGEPTDEVDATPRPPPTAVLDDDEPTPRPIGK